MDALTRFGLEKSRLTVLVMLALLIVGVSIFYNLPKRDNPAITIRTALVSAQFSGMSPERIEDLIADPIERKIREIGEVEDISTLISTGSTIITVDLYDSVGGDQIDAVFQDLRNKMGEVEVELPDGTVGPQVNTDYGDVAIATIAVTGDGFSLAEVEDVAEELQRQLYRMSGITKVTLSGKQDERIWLELDSRKLASIGVQLEKVLTDLQDQNVILPAGEIDADGTNIILEANGNLKSIEEIRSVLTKIQGLSGFVRLEDLMRVRRGTVEPKEKPIFFNGAPAVLVSVEMADTEDTQKLGAAIKTRLTAFEQSQPLGISAKLSTLQEKNVTIAINGALENVAQTFTIVFVVMLFFLGLRAATIISCIVPFTIMFALICMTQLGVDLEQVSIAAVIISLGLLVDNGLVVVEDIENRIASGVAPEEAAIKAGGQFFVPLAVASLTTVSAFMPMLLLSGTEGEYSYSLGAVVAAMLLGSWLTAHYILPLLCAKFLRPKPRTEAGTSRLIRWYGALTRKSLRFGFIIVVAAYCVVAGSLTLFSFLKMEMFPLSERDDFLIYMDMPKGTAIAETERQAMRVQKWLADESINPGVSNTTIFIGDGGPRFYLALDPNKPDPTKAFFVVNMASHEAAVALTRRARRHFAEYLPEARFRTTRLSMGGKESGIVDIEIRGPDADTLLAAAKKVEVAFSELPGLVKNENDWGNKVLKVVVDIAQDKARELGVTSKGISDVMNAYFSGLTYSTFRDGSESIPIVLRAGKSFRDSLEDLGNLSVASNGQLISLDQVATFRPALEFSQLRRENQRRQITISAKSSVLSANEVVASIQPTLDGLKLGPDYDVIVAGELKDSADVYTELGGNLPAALAIMLLALMFQFNSARRVALTFMTIPLILIGAPAAMILAGQKMSFFAVLGLMSLMGIIINNAIVLIDQIDLERETNDLAEAVTVAAQKRAKPIILTSLTTICGLLPMAIAGGVLFKPMATIMIGGLLVSSPLTLVFVPGLYYVLFKGRKAKTGDQTTGELDQLAMKNQSLAPAP
ncbi:MAG: efflux RND transporter permease subunit [Hyphomicrobiaceae bacterium]